MWRYTFLTLPLALPLGFLSFALGRHAQEQVQDGARNQAPPSIRVPFGLDPMPPALLKSFRADVAALGRKLFFDPILSVDRKTSCASCHRPENGFASPEKLPQGSLGKRALRHAPTLLNRAYGKFFSWDGKASDLETQTLMPIENPNEMALPIRDALKRLTADASYAATFKTVFGRRPARDDLSLALASYIRTLLMGDSVIDRFHAGQAVVLELEERAGMWIFESKGGCWKCHAGANFADEQFHNTGIGVRKGKAEPGRGGITGKDADWGGFKTPTLRGLTQTAPYMHDGSLDTLEDVVAFYRRGGNPNTSLDTKLRPLDLNDQEAGFLVAFLKALSRHPGVQEGQNSRQQKK